MTRPARVRQQSVFTTATAGFIEFGRAQTKSVAITPLLAALILEGAKAGEREGRAVARPMPESKWMLYATGVTEAMMPITHAVTIGVVVRSDLDEVAFKSSAPVQPAGSLGPNVRNSRESLMESSSAWVARWLDAVASGSTTMSQRKLTSVQKRGGGIDAVRTLAMSRGVHLLLIEDDQGNPIVAASAKPFTVLC